MLFRPPLRTSSTCRYSACKHSNKTLKHPKTLPLRNSEYPKTKPEAEMLRAFIGTKILRLIYAIWACIAQNTIWQMSCFKQQRSQQLPQIVITIYPDPQ